MPGVHRPAQEQPLARDRVLALDAAASLDVHRQQEARGLLGIQTSALDKLGDALTASLTPGIEGL
ncbi:MAG: hypothetical protein HYX52_09830 [Chloroflexi bacterium]|nr:hypothetical protein [Chloroflexota bacterium]